MLTENEQKAFESCLDLVRRQRKGTSLVEVYHVAKQFIPVTGDQMLGLGDMLEELNVFIWAEASHEFANVLGALQETGKIEAHSCSWFLYLVDGIIFRPVAKRPPKKGYKEPHWCPLVLNWKGEEVQDAAASA